MTLFDSGSGLAIVVVPGITGRWEWMRPALEALARRSRTLGYSLCGERGSDWPFPEGAPFETHLAQLDAVLAKAGVGRAVLCGVSFGGWIALRYGARRASRVVALVLSSAPGPCFRPDRRQQRYVRAPRLCAPAFVAAAHHRLGEEIAVAIPEPGARWRFRGRQLARIVGAPASPLVMARRMRCGMQEDFRGDCRRVGVPTLVLTGEPHLDRVVPVDSSREYLREIATARHAVLEGTGHLGVVTRPDAWAETVAGFARDVAGTEGTLT